MIKLVLGTISGSLWIAKIGRLNIFINKRVKNNKKKFKIIGKNFLLHSQHHFLKWSNSSENIFDFLVLFNEKISILNRHYFPFFLILF